MKAFSDSISNLMRHRFTTVATIISISLILVIFNVLIAVNNVTTNSINELANKINLNVFLTNDVTDSQVNELTAFVEKFTEVTHLEHVSQAEALKLIERKYPQSIEFLSDFDIENPLPQSLRITTKTLDDQNKIAGELEESKFKDLILKSEIKNQNTEAVNNVVQNLVKMKKFSFQILLWMIATFIIAGGLIIYNALKTTLYTRKNEIQIMQFVGATYTKIIAPYAFEGAILGGSSFLIA